MKKLNLNIKLKTQFKENDGKTDIKPADLAKRWIGIMVAKAINKPDPITGRATLTANMDVQRQYCKLIDVMNTAKDGVVEMEDELFNFMDRKFNQSEIAVQEDVAEILVKLGNAMNLAKVELKGE